MKNKIRLVTLTMSFLVTKAFSQEGSGIALPYQDQKIFIETIYETNNDVKKDLIYTALKQWVSKAFQNSKSVVDYEDKEAGIIICKGFYKGDRSKEDNLKIDFTLKIDIREGKYRVQYYDIKAGSLLFGGETFPLDVNRMNFEYATKETKPMYKLKYTEATLRQIRRDLDGISEDIRKAVNKTIENDDF